jgi:serine protease Do
VLNEVTVIFQDDSRHAAKVIGRDEKADSALLKIDTNENLTYVTWGRATTPRSAIGWSRSATRSGSAVREPPGSSPRLGATSNRALTTLSCQIDAPINRGNSGGLSFNLHGQVIGINTAIYSVSGGSVRMVRRSREHRQGK